MIAIADTETTGFPKPGAAIQPGQARVCQLAVLLCDDDGKHMTEFSTLIRLDEDTAMNIRAQEVHGISWDMCNKYGMSQRQAIDATLDIMCKADKVVFHNKKFDLQMLAIEVAYAGFLMPYMNTFCTMEATTDICKLPGKFGKHKWPKLSEALPILCGKEMGLDAHDAMVDTKAAKDIYFELVKRGVAC